MICDSPKSRPRIRSSLNTDYQINSSYPGSGGTGGNFTNILKEN
jgi:hypothetical protein